MTKRKPSTVLAYWRAHESIYLPDCAAAHATAKTFRAACQKARAALAIKLAGSIAFGTISYREI